MTSRAASFDKAMELHRQGRLDEAESIYADVLQQQPDHFDALHLLGVVAHQNGQLERAIELIGKAIGLKADVAVAHGNLGNALKDLNRPKEALISFERALALKPDFADAYYFRG